MNQLSNSIVWINTLISMNTFIECKRKDTLLFFLGEKLSDMETATNNNNKTWHVRRHDEQIYRQLTVTITVISSDIWDQEGRSWRENIRIYEDYQRELKVVLHCDPLSVWNINISLNNFSTKDLQTDMSPQSPYCNLWPESSQNRLL